MNLIKLYHQRVWSPIAWKIAIRMMRYPLTRRWWKLFCAHLQILAVLQVIAQPTDDVACYAYIFCRAKNPLYSGLSRGTRWLYVKRLWQKAWR